MSFCRGLEGLMVCCGSISSELSASYLAPHPCDQHPQLSVLHSHEAQVPSTSAYLKCSLHIRFSSSTQSLLCIEVHWILPRLFPTLSLAQYHKRFIWRQQWYFAGKAPIVTKSGTSNLDPTFHIIHLSELSRKDLTE